MATAQKIAKKASDKDVSKSAVKAPTKTTASASASQSTKSQTPKRSLDEQLNEAIAARNAASALKIIDGASVAERQQLASNAARMQSLAALPASAALNDCFDALYEYVTDANALQTFVEKRYGVTLGTKTIRGKIFKMLCCWDDTEQEWTANGARHLYYSLGLLPKSHVDKVTSITTMNTSDGGGGVALGWTGAYNVNYTDSNTTAIAGKGYCESKKDYKYDLVSLDCTMVHELGHIVDTGTKYSGRADFRAISDWKSEGKSAATIAAKIEEYAMNPYPEGLTSEEKEIAREGAKLLVKNRVVGDGNGNPKAEEVQKQVSNAYANLGKRSGKEGSFLDKALDFVKGNHDGNNYRSADALGKVLLGSTVYKHIARSFTYTFNTPQNKLATYMPWYKGSRADMKRQMHEGYEGRGWYSFSNEAWAQKISMYQFRDPGEEFAELYATYHVAKPKGSKTSAAHKAWFEKMGLHQDKPEKSQVPGATSKES